MDVLWQTRRAAASRVSVLRTAGFRHVLAAALLLLVVTSIPFVYAAASAPDDQIFTGVLVNVHDTAQYLTWMRESGSHIFIDNRLTSEPNPPIYFNLHWWLFGRLAATTGINLITSYHIMRVIAIPLLVVAVYWLCTLLVPDERRRRFAFWITLVGAGLGWLWVADKFAFGLDGVPFPTDVYTTPGNAFYTMLISPHLTLAMALLLFTLGLAYVGVSRNRLGVSAAAGLTAFALGQGHAYDLVTVWGVLGLFGLVITVRDGLTRRAVLNLGLVYVISAPAALYWVYVSSAANPVWQQALAQYDNLGVFTPDPMHLAILLGLRLIVALATYSGFVPVTAQDNRSIFLKSWMVAVLVLAYVPLKFRIMLLLGLELPLSILALDGLLDHIVPWIQQHASGLLARLRVTPAALARWSPALFLMVLIPTNIYLYGWRLLDMSRHDYPYFLYRDDLAAIDWIDTHTDEADVVLSSLTIGHFVPGLAGNRVFLGSAVMTANFNHKNEEVNRFFDGQTDEAWRRDLLDRYDIRYLVYGNAEREVGDYDPDHSPFLVKVFDSQYTDVYQVMK